MRPDHPLNPTILSGNLSYGGIAHSYATTMSWSGSMTIAGNTILTEDNSTSSNFIVTGVLGGSNSLTLQVFPGLAGMPHFRSPLWRAAPTTLSAARLR